ncbi:helix-turn-helix domain-containing protein [Sedimentitalea sp. JM2-8]|uniref:Helix-turn-helix domain-containing protein n=1 Tax=Sedimentitalea xiamensis TaxID=3050037 RepID=A0ABT7FEE2_9RHOB|nr:helix-turn-helix domain-containing protein [Sedimentitalea xiamensis]MDK3073491.1 helix-turn-helix domain-containing protein [Sedimentitalea xiamensis]
MYACHPSAYRDESIRIDESRKPFSSLPFQVMAEAHLYYAGDESPGLFEVRTGLFRLSRVTRNGRRYVVGFGYPGDVIGFCPDGVHLSDCEAVVDSAVIRHPTETLTSCRADPRAHQALVRAALREIQEMQDHCMLLGHNLAHERVAAFLTRLGERIGQPKGDSVAFDLPMSRLDIADFLGLTVETVSRSLTILRKAGIIEIRNLHRIVVLQPVRIDALAEPDPRVAPRHTPA